MTEPTFPGVFVYMLYEEFFDDDKPSVAALMAQIESLPYEPAMGGLLALSALISNIEEPFRSDVQQQIVAEIGQSTSYVRSLIDFLREHGNRVFVSEEQIGVLIRLCIQHRDLMVGKIEDLGDRLLRAMLLWNSLAVAETTTAIEQDAPEAKDERFVKLEIRSVLHDAENIRDVLGRYSEFMLWSRSEEGHTENYIDLDAAFNRFYGVSYDEWIAAALAFLSYYGSFRTMHDIRNRPLAPKYEALTGGLLESAVLDKFAKEAIIGEVALRTAFEQIPDTLSGAGLAPLLQQPLVKLQNAGIACPYIPYLRNKMGTGVYFALMDGFRREGGGAAVERFTRYFGQFFEFYVFQIFRRSYKAGGGAVYPEQTYLPGIKSTDVVIFDGSSAIFIEVVAKRFNFVKSVLGLEDAAIQRDIENMIIEKAEQLNRNIADFRSGSLRYDGVTPENIAKVFPVVCTITPVPQFIGVNGAVAKRIAETGLLSTSEPLQLMCAEDCEILEPFFAGSGSLSEIFSQKISHDLSRRISLKNFLLYSRPDAVSSAAQSVAGQDQLARSKAVAAKWYGDAAGENVVQ